MRTIDKYSKIAIIGAGISGPALAISLKKYGFKNLLLFEKDLSLSARRQGYGLTILQAKKALKQLGVLQEAKKINSPSKVHYIFDHKGEILGFYGTLFWDKLNNLRSEKSKQKGLSMHIPRQDLRKILIQQFNDQCKSSDLVRWNMKLTSLESKKQIIQLQFQNGKREQCDLVIGCDGIYSSLRERSIVEDNKLKYLGVVICLGLCSENHPLTNQRVFQSGNGKLRFFCMPFKKNSENYRTMWQLSMPLDLQTARRLSESPKQSKQFFNSLCRGWHQPIPQLINNTKLEDLMTITAFDRNYQQNKIKDNRIVLLGDALHPMSPFKGQGANQALLDAVLLGELISKNQNLDEIQKKFKEQVKKRAENKILESRLRVQKYHNTCFTQIKNYLYPRIDQKLIYLLRQNNINSKTGQQIEKKIQELMQKHNYFK